MNNSIEELRKIYREQYGKVIKKKRKKRNCSQEELAKILDVTGATISRYENGTQEMSASTLPVLCSIFDFDFADYMEEFNIHSVSERLCNAVRYIRSVKGAYPPTEWSMEQCKEEYERLLPILEKEIKNCNYEEIMIIGRMLGVLEECRFEKSERLFEIGKILRENLFDALSGHDGLVELLFKTQALKTKIYCK